CDGTGIQEKNPLLEEYVDCLHFILSIGLDCKFNDGKFYTSHKETTLEQFLRLFEKVGDFSAFPTKGNYECIFNYFLGLGEMLGFTWDEIEQAYLAKNKINHARQESRSEERRVGKEWTTGAAATSEKNKGIHNG